MVPRGGGFLNPLDAPETLPPWLLESDIDFYADQFRHTGYRGGLNWYRNIDRNWELLAAWAGAKVSVPALYVAGERDMVVAFQGMEKTLQDLRHWVPDLRDAVMLPGCGHWTQQERPAEVTAIMLD